MSSSYVPPLSARNLRRAAGLRLVGMEPHDCAAPAAERACAGAERTQAHSATLRWAATPRSAAPPSSAERSGAAAERTQRSTPSSGYARSIVCLCRRRHGAWQRLGDCAAPLGRACLRGRGNIAQQRLIGSRCRSQVRVHVQLQERRMTTPRRAAAPPSAAEQAGAVAEKHKAMLVRAATPLSTGVPIKASKGTFLVRRLHSDRLSGPVQSLEMRAATPCWSTATAAPSSVERACAFARSTWQRHARRLRPPQLSVPVLPLNGSNASSRCLLG